MDNKQIIDYLVELLNDSRYYNGSHYNMLKELCEKFATSEAEMLELYRQTQQIWKEQQEKRGK